MQSRWRATVHWTAGRHTPNLTDIGHYHVLITGDGNVVSGKYKPENNIPPYSAGYAAHCHKQNSYNIGIALCGMFNYSPGHPSPAPITKVQFEKLCEVCAELSLHEIYRVPVADIKTHYERGEMDKKLGVWSLNIGKLDITHLPFEPSLKPEEIGNHMRQKILWYRQKLQEKENG